MIPGGILFFGAFIATVVAALVRHFLVQTRKDDLSAEDFANYKYQSSSATNLLSQEHMEAIALRQWKMVLAWVAFHSDQVSRVEDINGQTALHHAALFRAPAQVMEMLLWAAPELASIPNKDGELALHWAVRLSTPNPVLVLLLRANPQSPFWADSNGSTPLALLWERHQISLLQTWRSEKERLLNEADNVWKRIMSVYRALQISEEERRDPALGDHDDTFHPVHLAAAHSSPPCLFPLILQVYKDMITKPDSKGRLPLAIACQSPLANRSCDVLTKIQLLVRENPAASTFVDSTTARYPLHIALWSGVLWNDGVKSLIRSYPIALSYRDQKSRLFPFSMAAMFKPKNQQMMPCPLDEDRLILDTVYNVLRAEPSVLRLSGY